MLRQLIYSQQQDEGAATAAHEAGAGHVEAPYALRSPRASTAAAGPSAGVASEEDALLEQGRLGAAIWRRKGLKEDDAGLSAPALAWRRVGTRPGPKAPLYHWPTSLLPAFLETPRLLHVHLLRRMLPLLRAAQDTAGVATVLRLLQSTEPGKLDLEVIDANLWLLQRAHSRQQQHHHRHSSRGRRRSNGAAAATMGMSDQHFRRVVMLLRALMGTRILLPPAPEGETAGPKSLAPPDALRVQAFSRLTSFLLLGAGAGRKEHVAQAREMLQQEGFLRPFSDSPHLLLARALVGCIDLLQQQAGTNGVAPAATAHDALARLAQDPLGCLRSSQAGIDKLEPLVKDAARAYEAAATPEGRDGALALHAALLAVQASAGGDGKGRRNGRGKGQAAKSDGSPSSSSASEDYDDDEGQGAATAATERVATALRLLWDHTQASHFPSPTALQTAHRAAAALLGRDHPRALGYLKAWVDADPTSDAALAALLRAYRRQLLRSYRDPSAPVRVGKARVARALLERLATLPPGDAPESGEEGEAGMGAGGGRRLRCFRWLAQCLGPVPASSDEQGTWLLAAADGTDKAAAQEVMAGRFQAWAPCLRGWGAEELVADLFPLREVVRAGDGDGAGDGQGPVPFGHKWYEAETAGGGWTWPPRDAGDAQWREREAVWSAVKYGKSGLGDRAEVEEGEVDHAQEAVAFAGGRQQEEEDEENRVLAACAGVDDSEAGWLGGGGGGDGDHGRLRAGLLLLAYKAVAAAHLMGPTNGYSTAALRLLWDRAHGTHGTSVHALLGMLRAKFRLDVPALLRASDRLLLTTTTTAASTHHLGPDPAALAQAQAATGWPLPALHPPELLAPALAAQAGPYRPRPLPGVDVGGDGARRLKEVFGRAAGADPREQKRLKRRRQREEEKGGGVKEEEGAGTAPAERGRG